MRQLSIALGMAFGLLVSAAQAANECRYYVSERGNGDFLEYREGAETITMANTHDVISWEYRVVEPQEPGGLRRAYWLDPHGDGSDKTEFHFRIAQVGGSKVLIADMLMYVNQCDRPKQEPTKLPPA